MRCYTECNSHPHAQCSDIINIFMGTSQKFPFLMADWYEYESQNVRHTMELIYYFFSAHSTLLDAVDRLSH